MAYFRTLNYLNSGNYLKSHMPVSSLVFLCMYRYVFLLDKQAFVGEIEGDKGPAQPLTKQQKRQVSLLASEGQRFDPRQQSFV